MKKIAILGSTGSIGTQALEIAGRNGDLWPVALAAGNNITLLEQQIREFHPLLVAVWREDRAKELAIRVADTPVKVVWGMEGLIEVATCRRAQMVLTAVVGMIGIRPTIAAIEAGKDIALANKETLVTAGHIIMAMAKNKGVKILPVDSEHSAIYQCLQGESGNRFSRILLTASGGPFRGFTRDRLKAVRLEDALKHPNWSMGKKITIDSSTMVNKGLEVIEAKWLFQAQIDQIEVVIQPQSIIHSMVEFEDGAVMAQLGTPDMKLPIQYAFYESARRPLDSGRLDFKALREITFEPPDFNTFWGLRLAYQAGREGGTLPTVFNAANEWAVARFLQKKIEYLAITDIIQDAMEHHQVVRDPSVDQILEAERETYGFIESRWID